MFEQSIVEMRGASKPWTLVAMTGQIAAMGLALMIPLIHPEVLNAPRMFMSIVYQMPEPASPEIQVRASSGTPRSGGPALPTARPRVFQAPSLIPTNVAVIIDPPGAMIASLFSKGGAGIDVGPGIPFGIGNAIPVAGPPAPPTQATPAAKDLPAPIARIKQGGKVQEARMLHRVIPIYPPLAKAARIQGLVRLEGIIARDGTIQQLRVMSGHPLLVQAALDAVRQWRYNPTHLNGEPVEVIAPIDVNFILSN
jgi:periplasmic protein TonB